MVPNAINWTPDVTMAITAHAAEIEVVCLCVFFVKLTMII